VWDIDEISILSCCELCDVVGGDISSDSESLLCDNSDQSQELSIELTEGTGDSNLLFILDDQGRILSYQDSLIIHPDSIILDSFIVQSISYSGMVTGLEVGAFVSDLNGCFNLSNQLEFVKVIPMGGELSSNNSLLVCLGDGLPDIINFTVDNDQGDNSFFIITDNSGAISDVITDSSYDFGGTPPGICFVFHVSYYGNLEGLEIGSDINEIDGCFHLSNSLQITKDCDLLGAISGYVYKVDGLTEDRLGVEGVTITLIDMDGNIVKTAETNADGYYIFQVLESGSYSVFSPGPETGCEDVSDQDESTDPFNDPDGGSDPVNNAIPVNLDTGENDEDNNFVDAVTIVIPVELISSI